MTSLDETPWSVDWAWSLPLILLNVIIHVFGLACIYDGFTSMLQTMERSRRYMAPRPVPARRFASLPAHGTPGS